MDVTSSKMLKLIMGSWEQQKITTIILSITNQMILVEGLITKNYTIFSVFCDLIILF